MNDRYEIVLTEDGVFIQNVYVNSEHEAKSIAIKWSLLKGVNQDIWIYKHRPDYDLELLYTTFRG